MKTIEFIANTDDDLHCVQAAFLMIVRYFKPEFEIGWEEWSRVTGFEAEKGSWATSSILWLNDHGFDVKAIEKFDYSDFANRGKDYLREIFPQEDYEYAVRSTNFESEEKLARKLSAKDLVENRAPNIEDIRHGIDNGYLVRAHVNSRKLDGLDGYIGHSVVIFDYDENGFLLHDPGNPPRPNFYAKLGNFVPAAFGDDGQQGEINLVRLI